MSKIVIIACNIQHKYNVHIAVEHSLFGFATLLVYFFTILVNNDVALLVFLLFCGIYTAPKTGEQELPVLTSD